MSDAEFSSTNYTCNREKNVTSAACGAALPVASSSAAALRVQNQLVDANACAQSSIAAGAHILSDLNNQRETLINAHGSMRGTSGALQVCRAATGPAPSVGLFICRLRESARHIMV